MRYFLKIFPTLGVMLLFTNFSSTNTMMMKIDDPSISPQTEECIMCHSSIHPGIVNDWYKGLHSKSTPALALKKEASTRRMSNENVPDTLKNYTVGCYECHALNTKKHTDAFEHNGYVINLVVSSGDCATCHTTEKQEYEMNLMSHAYGNLMNNKLYQDLMTSINGNYELKEGSLNMHKADDLTNSESCLYCHGTKLEVTGMAQRETDFGELEFPEIKGWPNNGVGRINTDGSKGSCTVCHPRHEFSIQTARKPYTCAECHKGPDVPAYKIYEASKHGNIFNSQSDKYNFNSVPWVIGKDFTVPSCAACHASQLADTEGNIIADRTHRFNDRLAWRLFGVPYAHPHPIQADISNVKNSAGLPLITELDSKPVSDYVIDETEQDMRNNAMQKICKSCHGTSWVNGHFKRLDHSIHMSNKNTVSATNIIAAVWDKGYAEGIPQGKSLFDETVERYWTSIWLFYANSIRMSSAMGGGGDYGVFADGRYQMTNALIRLNEWYENHGKKKKR